MLCLARTSAVALRGVATVARLAPAAASLASRPRPASAAPARRLVGGPAQAPAGAPDLHALLGVSPAAPLADLRRAYQEALLECLPEDEVDDAAAEAASARMESMSLAFARLTGGSAAPATL